VNTWNIRCDKNRRKLKTMDDVHKEALNRRDFMKLSITILATISGIAVGLPLIGSVIGPALQKTQQHFTKVGKISSIKTGTPVDLNFADLTEDAFIRNTNLHSVWVIKNSDTDVAVYSPICPHLGCRYKWQADSDNFVCPCHDSVFSKDGKVLAGPAPRPLDTLPAKIENGELYVEWEQYKEGIAQKEAI
jgi:menaquinol-cytochrome c reductase iron-sulfur subunit